MSSSLHSMLLILGGATALYICTQILGFLWLHVLRASTLSRYLHDSRNGDKAWALVTGASDGIGRGFAEELCSRGFNVVLHGRNATKLESVQGELLEQWPNVEVRFVVLDAIVFTEEAMRKMLDELKELNLTILINNVGGSPPLDRVIRPLQTLEFRDIDAFISINARFPAQLTAKLLSQLRSNEPALIINVGSFVGLLPSAYLSVYSGSKAFISAWSRSIEYEMRAEEADVEVISLWVGEVQAQWNLSPTHFLRPSSRQFANSALHKVGCGSGLVAPYVGHALQVAALFALPEWSKKFVLVRMAKQLIVEEATWTSKEK